MMTEVQAADENEAKMIQTGLQDASLRAFVEVCAVLKPLSDDAARLHVLAAAVAMYTPGAKP